jgi:hypothetical protein
MCGIVKLFAYRARCSMLLSCLAAVSSLAGLTFDLHFLHSKITKLPNLQLIHGQYKLTMLQFREGSELQDPCDSIIAQKDKPVPPSCCHFCKSLIARALNKKE